MPLTGKIRANKAIESQVHKNIVVKGRNNVADFSHLWVNGKFIFDIVLEKI